MLERKIRRYRLMDAHRELVRSGKYSEAKEVLSLLRKGRVKLGLSDCDWMVEKLCEDMGFRIGYSINGNTSTVYM